MPRNRSRPPLARRPARDLPGRDRSDAPWFQQGMGPANAKLPLAPLCSAGMRDPTDTNVAWNSCNQRTPIIFRLANGKLAALWRSLEAFLDHRARDVLGAISSDNGNTWGPTVLVYRQSTYVSNAAWNDGITAMCDSMGRVHLLVAQFASSTLDGVYTSSSQHYLYTDNLSLAAGWVGPTAITASVNPSANPWFVFGPHKGIQMKGGALAGAIVFPIDFRTTVGGTSYAGYVYSTDRGATWNRRNVDTAVAANDNSNETAICEIGSSGRLYLNSRLQGGNGRKHCVVTDLTATPVAAMTLATTDGAATLPSYSCQGAVESNPAGDIFLTCVGVAVSPLRGHLSVFTAVDGLNSLTPTFRKRRSLCHRASAYSAIITIPSGLLVLYENTTAIASENAATRAIWYEFTSQARFNRAWAVADPSVAPEVIEYHFNEATSGAVSRMGAQVIDHGTHNNPAQGSAAAGASWAAGHMTFDGNNLGLLLGTAQYGAGETFGGPWDWPTALSWTLEMRLRVPVSVDAGDGVIIDTRNNGTGRGWTLKFDTTTRKLVISWCDGVAANTTRDVSSVAINDNVWRNYAITRDRGTLRIRSWQDADDGNFAEVGSATVDPSGACIGDDCRLGSRQASTTDAGKFDISFLRFTRGKAKTSRFAHAGNVVKQSPADFALGPAPSLPSSASNLAFCIPFWGKGRGLRADRYGHSFARPGAGAGTVSARDQILARCFGPYSDFRTESLQVSSKIGLCTRPMWVDANTGGTIQRNSDVDKSALAATDVDFLQNTGVGALSIVVEFLASTGSTQVLMSTSDTETSAPFGFYFRRQADNTMSLAIVGNPGGSPGYVINESTFGAFVAANDTPYYFGIDLGGASGKATLFYGAYTAGLTPPSSLSSIVSASTIIASFTGQPWASTFPLAIASRGDGFSRAPNLRYKNPMIFNAAIGQAQHLEWAKMAVAD